MEKQEIRTFGRRHGKKLSARQQTLVATLLPAITPKPTELNGGDAILEIGFGAGEHVRALADEHPDTIIVGAEPFMNGVASLMSAMTDEKTNAVFPEYKNIRIWADDVRDFLRGAPNTKFREIWVLHPDPWPKAKHEKRRLLNATFLTLISNYLTPDGRIIIGTDHWEYYDWIEQQIPNTPLVIRGRDMDMVHTRYQSKNKAETAAPKYLILGRA